MTYSTRYDLDAANDGAAYDVDRARALTHQTASLPFADAYDERDDWPSAAELVEPSARRPW